MRHHLAILSAATVHCLPDAAVMVLSLRAHLVGSAAHDGRGDGRSLLEALAEHGQVPVLHTNSRWAEWGAAHH